VISFEREQILNSVHHKALQPLSQRQYNTAREAGRERIGEYADCSSQSQLCLILKRLHDSLSAIRMGVQIRQGCFYKHDRDIVCEVLSYILLYKLTHRMD
jgi:hypothetical protein